MGTRVKTADKRWNSLHNTYELTLTSGSIIRLVDDPAVEESIPDILFDFVPLQDISKHANESFIGKRFWFVRSCVDIILYSMKMLLASSRHVPLLFHSRIELQIKIPNVANSL